MAFYEFNRHEYYALIQAKGLIEACEYYVEYVGHESVDDVLEESHPDLISELQALVKLADAINSEETEVPVSEVTDILFNPEIPLKLIDGSLT